MSVKRPTIGQLKPAAKLTHLRSGPPLLAVLFVILLGVYAYTPPRWQDWNQNSRFNLTRAIVEQQTLRIDDYADNTGDYAEYEGHLYTDKAPGLSLLAVPFYGLVELLEPLGIGSIANRVAQSGSLESTLNPEGEGLSESRVDSALALYVVTFFTVSIPGALMIVVLAYLVQRLTGCQTAGILSGLAVGLATPVFTYSQAFYGHVPAAACVVGGLALVATDDENQASNRRIFAIGVLLSTAVLLEYLAVVLCVPIALFALYKYRGQAITFGLLGGIPALLILVAYDLLAFGTPLPIGYQHSALWQEQHSTGFMSLTHPTWESIWGLTFSPFRGLFFFSPILLLALPGAWLLLRRPTMRMTGLLTLSGYLLFFVIISSSIMWWGGFSVGPRYLVPALPLLGIPLGASIAAINDRDGLPRVAGLAVVGFLSWISATAVWAATFAGQNYPPDSTRRPFADYIFPAIEQGDVARNLGMVLQLEGLSSLVPLLIITVIGTGYLGLRLTTSEPGPT